MQMILRRLKGGVPGYVLWGSMACILGGSVISLSFLLLFFNFWDLSWRRQVVYLLVLTIGFAFLNFLLFFLFSYLIRLRKKKILLTYLIFTVFAGVWINLKVLGFELADWYSYIFWGWLFLLFWGVILCLVKRAAALVVFTVCFLFLSSSQVSVEKMKFIPIFNEYQHHQEYIYRQDMLDYEYSIHLDGTLDPENIFLSIENKGKTPIINPRIIANDMRDWYSIETILAETISPGMSDEEKAMALWNLLRSNSYHYKSPEDGCFTSEINDPVKLLNVYGYCMCGDIATALHTLWESVGLEAEIWGIYGHVVSQVKYNDQFHLLDGDLNMFYLLPDNQTVASREDLDNDTFLVKTDNPDSRQSFASLYGQGSFGLYGGKENGETKMSMILRPNERFEWHRDWKEKYHENLSDPGPPSYYSNGKLVYTPDLSNSLFRDYLIAEENISTQSETPRLHLKNAEKPGQMILEIKSPYVIVGGVIKAEFWRNSSDAQIEVWALNPQTSERVCVWKTSDEEVGFFSAEILLDDFIAPLTTYAKYSYQLMFEMSSFKNALDAGINSLAIETQVQIAPRSLPSLKLGDNTIRYTDETPHFHKVLITQVWQENSDNHPPFLQKNRYFPKTNRM